MTRKEQAKQTKRKIVASVMHLLSKERFSDIKVTDICTAANISVGAFYHYFPTKEEVLLSTGEVFDAWLEERMNANQYTSSREKLAALIENFFYNASFSGANGVRALYAYQLESEENSFSDLDRYFTHNLKQILEDGFASGEFKGEYPLTDTWRLIIHLIRGITYDWALAKGDFDVVVSGNQQTKKLLAVLLDG